MPPKRMIVDIFKMPFPTRGATRDLIEHYSYGEANLYELSREQMLEVYPLATPDGTPVDLSLAVILPPSP